MKQLFSITVFSFLISNIFSPTANAKITIFDVQGASTVQGLNSQQITIYGGTAGTISPSQKMTHGKTCTTCYNTCVGTNSEPLRACNENAVVGTTQLDISFTSDTMNGLAGIYGVDASGKENLLSTQITYTAGSKATVSINWSNILGTANYTSYDIGITPAALGQEEKISFTIVAKDFDNDVGNSISSSANNGISEFQLYPGDSKAYVVSLSPASFNSDIVAVRAFYEATSSSTNACTEITKVTNSSASVELPLFDNQLRDNRIMGLTNNTAYIFRFAVQDIAGNIGLFTDPSTLTCDFNKHGVIPQQFHN